LESATQRRAIRIALQAMAIQVVDADADQNSQHCDVIIIDSGTSPDDAACLLKSNATTSALILIPPSERHDFAEYHARGVAGFLVKPFRPNSLFERLAADDGQASRGEDGHQGNQRETPSVIVQRTDAPRRLLLVEDNDINALLAKSIIKKAGFEVDHLTNGKKAFDEMKSSIGRESRLYDLILMDVHMPEMDGLEATTKIQSLFKVSGVANDCPPIIALTANAFSEDRQKCLEAGMNDYLAKPFEMDDLIDIIDKWCATSPRTD